jgi:predicted metal-dependent phosphoesterase TrpH
MLIDLHTHTSPASPCSILSPEDLILMAKERGIDAVCITDHDTTEAVQTCKDMGQRYGLLVFGGMEVRCVEGDILTFGLWERPAGRVFVQELVAFVNSLGGVTIPAHPFRIEAPSLGNKVWEVRGFDAIEVLNGNASDYQNQLACKAAMKLNLYGTGGSDAHVKSMVGKCATLFEDHLQNEKELIAAIKGGRFHPVDSLGRKIHIE